MFAKCALVSCVISIVFLGASLAPATTYYYVDLGAAGDSTASAAGSMAYGINSSNEVAGRYFPSSGGSSAFVWSPSFARTAIPALNGGATGVGFGINDNGTVVGLSSASGGNHAFYWTPTVAHGNTGTLTDVGVRMPGVTAASRLVAINSLGQTVGYGSVSGTTNGYYWDGSSASAEHINGPVGGSNAGWCFGAGINDSGLCVGYNAGPDSAVVWHSGDANATSIGPDIQTAMAPLEGGVSSYATAVNNGAQIAGYYLKGMLPNAHGFLYNNSSNIVDLGDLGNLSGDTKPQSTNSKGVVVGLSSPGVNGSGGEIDHAFIWTPTTPNGTTGAMSDLNNAALYNATALPAGYYMKSATGINSMGSISGYMYNDTTNSSRAFALIATMPGDASLDGTVNITDLSKVLTNYDRSGSNIGWTDGDFNGDGSVNISDLSNVLTNYDSSVSAGAGGIQAVPEPSMLVLLAAGLAGLTAWVWQKR
jgi:probable HAF family extracellular repeat protein